MKNRSRLAAKVAGVVAAGALVFGATGAAMAASQNVSFKLDSGSVKIGPGEPFALNPATGVTGTWDDVTGEFTGTFTSAPTQLVLDQVAEGIGTVKSNIVVTNNPLTPVTGNINPTTGIGTASLGLDVEILIVDASINGAPAIPIGATCHLNPITIPFNAVATGQGSGSVVPTALSLTAAGFTVPAATCSGAAQALLDLLVPGINKALGIVAPATSTTDTAATIVLSAGAIPPPPTTTTFPPATTTTTAAPTAEEEAAAEEEEAGAAGAVTAQASFTG